METAERKYMHTERNGFLLGTIDFFTAGLFFVVYMQKGLQDELDGILGYRTQRYLKVYLHGIPDLFLYPLSWMGRIAEELKQIAADLGIEGKTTSFAHMVLWNTIGLPLFGPSIATMRFFDTLNQIEKKLNENQDSGLHEAMLHESAIIRG